MTRPRLEVADVFRQHAEPFVERYGDGLSHEQRRVLRDITACRTAALGGHVEECDRCGHRQVAYNSYRNHHRPKCRAAARWMQDRKAELLPVEYFHPSHGRNIFELDLRQLNKSLETRPMSPSYQNEIVNRI